MPTAASSVFDSSPTPAAADSRAPSADLAAVDAEGCFSSQGLRAVARH